MAFLSIHTMQGDPDDLLARKRQHMDPVTERLAPAFGALASVTSRTETGILTVNVWETAEGVAAFSQAPEALAAHQASGLPRPATFERFADADCVFYQKGWGPVAAEPVADRETAVLVPVPEAERVVSPHRSRLDGAAALGVPAHVTVLFPFVPPPLITPGVVDALAAAVASVSAFGCEFPATSWFGENVLYLAPRPDEPFRALTRAVCAAFPGYLPYGGAFADTIPHLTVGERERGSGRPAGGVPELRAAEAAVLPQLPIRSRVSQVWLMAGSSVPGSWHSLAEFPLAAG